MTDPIKTFGDSAASLARNPLGIIALFIVLVYGFASLVTTFSDSFSHSERVPLIYFLILFPVLVLFVFAWLVAKHSHKLYGPSDFRDEENYLKSQSIQTMQLRAATSLAVASASNRKTGEEPDVQGIVHAVQSAGSTDIARLQQQRILWVDDSPSNNTYVKRALESVGLQVDIALSTDEALQKIANGSYSAIISDMRRPEGDQAGYDLLMRVRSTNKSIPFFIYSSSNAPHHKTEALRRGSQGATNNAQELFEMVTTGINAGGHSRFTLSGIR